MNGLALFLKSSTLMGLGATLTLDLWSLFLKRVIKITPSNFCLVGRWLRYMPEGIFKHSNIAAVPGKSGECMLGWVAHYLIGVTFAMLFVVFVGADWLKHPTLIPAITFGVFTVVAPFFIMQPAFGLGIAAAKASNSTSARMRSLINHFAFGFGLYIFGMLLP